MSTIANMDGSVVNGIYLFPLVVNDKLVRNMVLDTGANELTFNGNIAKNLGLPRLGKITMSGVGGIDIAFRSFCSLHLGSWVFSNVPCIIDPYLTETGLFGLRFLIDNNLGLELNPNKKTFKITSD